MPINPMPALETGRLVHAPIGRRFGRSVARSVIIAAVALAAKAGAAEIPRPWGLAHTPSYVPTYNSSAGSADIPADALDRSAYGSISDWLAACLAQNKPGKIGSGTYNITSSDLKRYAPKGIYGYGATKPIFSYTGGAIANATPGFLYLGKYPAFTARYLEFRNFGDV